MHFTWALQDALSDWGRPAVLHSGCRAVEDAGLRAHGVVVSHPLRMRKALGSIPSVSILSFAVSMSENNLGGVGPGKY